MKVSRVLEVVFDTTLWGLAVTGFVAGGISAACTKQGVVTAVENLAVEAAVDTCQEAPTILPVNAAPGLVSLVCNVFDNPTKTVQVLTSAATWEAQKAAFLAEHGALPAGMKLVALDAGK